MEDPAKQQVSDLVDILITTNYLFRGMDRGAVIPYLSPDNLSAEKLYSNRPIFTAFRPDQNLQFLYAIAHGGPVILRSAPLDRVISMTYRGGCFGMRNLYIRGGNGIDGKTKQGFPSLVEAYKTTDAIKIPVEAVEKLYQENQLFRDRYHLLLELREKFQYHLLNCSTYPPQAVAALLRALVYQEKKLGNQPNAEAIYDFDLPVDLIARACQLNHRTVEQVLKGMQKVGLIKLNASEDSQDSLLIIDAEGLKEVYSSTRDKVSWWPLR